MRASSCDDDATSFSGASLRAWLAQLGLGASEDLFPALAAAYGAEARHYHTGAHVAACLRHLAEHEALALRPAEIAVALWFHDAVYDSRRDDNEARSAAWAADCLAARGLDAAAVARIQALILATCHAATPTDDDQRLLVDIDRAILGAPADVFATYDAAIGREYAWLPAARYRAGRIAVLAGFLARPYIYATSAFRERYEARARANLADAIEGLRA